jgi:hypothetical protein
MPLLYWVIIGLLFLVLTYLTLKRGFTIPGGWFIFWMGFIYVVIGLFNPADISGIKAYGVEISKKVEEARSIYDSIQSIRNEIDSTNMEIQESADRIRKTEKDLKDNISTIVEYFVLVNNPGMVGDQEGRKKAVSDRFYKLLRYAAPGMDDKILMMIGVYESMGYYPIDEHKAFIDSLRKAKEVAKEKELSEQ